MTLITNVRQQSRTKVGELLTVVLASEYMLYSRTRIAHWNVEGFDFYYKHTFFEDQYKQLDMLVESVAERIRSLNRYAPASPGLLLQQAHCHLQEEQGYDGRSLVAQLLAQHEMLIDYLQCGLKRLDIELYDLGGSEFITSLRDTHEKMAWMLRAHLK